MAENTATIALGTTGIYTDTRGFQKAALVIATPQSVQPGHRIEVPNEGTVNIMVFSASGNGYLRAGVPTTAPTNEDGAAEGAFFTA